MSGTVESCTCPTCISACRQFPGLMTPAEAVAAISAGYASRLMEDWLEPSDEFSNEERIYMLAPASLGHEGAFAPEMEWGDFFFIKGQCTFLKNDRCEIHDSGFKPIQCRYAHCSEMKANPSNYDMARMWDTPEGEAALELWERTKGVAA